MFVTKRDRVTSENHVGIGESRGAMIEASAAVIVAGICKAAQDGICGRKSIKRGRNRIRDLLLTKSENRGRIYPAGPRGERTDQPKTGNARKCPKKRSIPSRRRKWNCRRRTPIDPLPRFLNGECRPDRWSEKQSRVGKRRKGKRDCT